MNKEQRLLLKLAQSALGVRELQLSDIDNIDWTLLYQLTVDSKLVGIVYGDVAKISGEGAPPIELITSWKAILLRKLFRQMTVNNHTRKLIEHFVKANIQYIIFKGPVLSDSYPNPTLRQSKDIDILVSQEYLSVANKILIENGYIQNKSKSNECVFTWEIPDQLEVELHTNLWEDYQGKQVERLKQMNLTATESLITLDTCIGSVVTMNHTEHLIYQMFHIVKHMIYKGLDLRVFLDTTLFVNRYIEEIDVERFWNCIDQLRYTNFCKEMFQACQEYFNMNNQIFLKGQEQPGVGVDFMEKVMESAFRNSFDSVYTIVTDAVFRACLKDQHSNKTAQIQNGRLSTIIYMIFPSSKSLSGHYSYAKKYPFLLPIAWIHRLIFKLLPKKELNHGLAEVQRGLSIANKRTGLLREYTLID